MIFLPAWLISLAKRLSLNFWQLFSKRDDKNFSEDQTSPNLLTLRFEIGMLINCGV